MKMQRRSNQSSSVDKFARIDEEETSSMDELDFDELLKLNSELRREVTNQISVFD